MDMTNKTPFIQKQKATACGQYGSFKVVMKHRVQTCRPSGIRPDWFEYQVVQGNKVLARFELLKPAMEDADRRFVESLK
jgi:hypothetical protein